MLNGLTVLSLVLCVATVVLWVRGIGHMGSMYWLGPEHHFEISSTDGVLGAILARDGHLRPIVSGTTRLDGFFSWRAVIPAGRNRARFTSPSFNKWGFGFWLIKTICRPTGWWRFGGRKLVIVYAPFWLAVPVLAMPPISVGVALVRRKRRAKEGCCPICGYNLTGNVSGVCSECGTVIAKKTE